jgi:hypothetical protein
MEKTIDVVYVLGSGSSWKNNEIRYSLRSLEKNAIGLGKIFIVGELPEFLSAGIIHIPAADIFNPNENADGNIATKVLAACADERLSDDFLFINDDHIILKPIALADVPAFHKGDMNSFPDSTWELNFWRKRLKRTMEILNQKGLTAYHFDCHTPILFNKNLFPEVMKNFPYQEGIGLTMKSLYGNSHYSDSGVLLSDQKKTVFKYYTKSQLDQRLAECGFMSFNDFGLNDALKIWLDETFSERSTWELSASEDRILEITRWLKSDRDYMEGVKLFEKYLKGANLINILRSGETNTLRTK